MKQEHGTNMRMWSLCRDCDMVGEADSTACPACGSSRLVSHRRLPDLTIAHIDCDAFFAAVEKRDNPDLRDKPVIVGGGQRGVVATCCYLARLHGVRSAMPMFKALKLCPEAVVVRPRREAYISASRQIREKLQTLTPLVQMISIDEGYLDLTGTERINGAIAAATLSRIAREIEDQIGITISVGLSQNKFLAKTASEMDKPRGFAVIGAEDARELLGPKPIGYLHGVGPSFARKLEGAGLKTVGDVQKMDMRDMIGRYGETGLWLHQRASGIDTRAVTPESERKSVSAERTFDKDISDPALLLDRLWLVCEETAERAKHHGIEGTTITLKLKTKQFYSLTRSVSLPTGTQLAQTLFRTAKPLLLRETERGQSYRLIGIGLSHLQGAKGDERDLIDPRIEKRAKAERASDVAREKFGRSSVMTGREIRAKSK